MTYSVFLAPVCAFPLPFAWVEKVILGRVSCNYPLGGCTLVQVDIDDGKMFQVETLRQSHLFEHAFCACLQYTYLGKIDDREISLFSAWERNLFKNI